MDVLNRMIRTGGRPSRPVLVPPGNLIARQSTDILAMDNPELVQAMRFIQNHCDRPILVEDVLKKVPMSRRYLEIQCQKLLGRSPREHIQHAHVARAKMLMEQYDLSLADIADMSGFRCQATFSIVFKRLAKMTPGQYRRQLPARETGRTGAR